MVPEDQRPKWKELPKRFNLANCNVIGSTLQRAYGGSSALENPPINPVTGFGRTSAEVHREMRAYRAALRRKHAADEYAPVFQGDYLFVQLPSKPVCLARVVHDCCIDDALSPTITFKVSEYTHTPQAGVTGFFGTFTKKVNEYHNPQDPKRTGPKFVRIQHISRHEIVVYDVQTWLDKELIRQMALDESPPEDCVRVMPSSLRALAAKVPELACPAELPQSHQAKDREESVARQAQEQRDRYGDDPPPPVPDAFEVVPCNGGDGKDVRDFMLWTRIGLGQVQWYQGKVVKRLKPGHRAGYTHDATFDAAPGVRGVRLTKAAYDEGCWVALKKKQQEAPAREARVIREAPRCSTSRKESLPTRARTAAQQNS